MRGKKVKQLRKIALAVYPPSESDHGYPEHSATYWGPQWRRAHRWLKRATKGKIVN